MYPNWVHLTYCDPHAYAERYPHSPSSPPHIEGISIHAPKWSATRSGTIVTITRSSFNPLAHAGRDRTRIWCRQDQAVPIHTLTRGATCSSSIWYRTELKFQSTRPHGARPFPFGLRFQYVKVSIHAPTRGATLEVVERKDGEHVSIHAPTRGATPQSVLATGHIGVSIHAPTRGATRHGQDNQREEEFQSTRPHGARPRTATPSTTKWWFQSTRPHGARLQDNNFWQLFYGCFNPCAHTGRDG